MYNLETKVNEDNENIIDIETYNFEKLFEEIESLIYSNVNFEGNSKDSNSSYKNKKEFKNSEIKSKTTELLKILDKTCDGFYMDYKVHILNLNEKLDDILVKIVNNKLNINFDTTNPFCNLSDLYLKLESTKYNTIKNLMIMIDKISREFDFDIDKLRKALLKHKLFSKNTISTLIRYSFKYQLVLYYLKNQKIPASIYINGIFLFEYDELKTIEYTSDDAYMLTMQYICSCDSTYKLKLELSKVLPLISFNNNLLNEKLFLAYLNNKKNFVSDCSKVYAYIYPNLNKENFEHLIDTSKIKFSDMIDQIYKNDLYMRRLRFYVDENEFKFAYFDILSKDCQDYFFSYTGDYHIEENRFYSCRLSFEELSRIFSIDTSLNLTNYLSQKNIKNNHLILSIIKWVFDVKKYQIKPLIQYTYNELLYGITKNRNNHNESKSFSTLKHDNNQNIKKNPILITQIIENIKIFRETMDFNTMFNELGQIIHNETSEIDLTIQSDIAYVNYSYENRKNSTNKILLIEDIHNIILSCITYIPKSFNLSIYCKYLQLLQFNKKIEDNAFSKEFYNLMQITKIDFCFNRFLINEENEVTENSKKILIYDPEIDLDTESKSFKLFNDENEFIECSVEKKMIYIKVEKLTKGIKSLGYIRNLLQYFFFRVSQSVKTFFSFKNTHVSCNKSGTFCNPQTLILNERVLLQWLSLSLLLSSLGLALITGTDFMFQILGVVYSMISIFFLIRSYLNYKYRIYMIRHSDEHDYADLNGPFLFVSSLVLVIFTSALLKLVNR